MIPRRFITAAGGAVVISALLFAGGPPAAHADNAFDGRLAADTNSDRANVCHRGGFSVDAPLSAIAQARANYIASSGDFSHINGVPPAGAGAENIGWTSEISDPTAAADAVNQAYLNSADHVANICDARWTEVGIGSAFVPSWNGQSDVWFDAVEFGPLGGGNASGGTSAPPQSSNSAPVGGVPGPAVGVPGTGGAG